MIRQISVKVMGVFVIVGIAFLCLVPALQLLELFPFEIIDLPNLVLTNFCAWILILFFFLNQRKLKNETLKVADELGLDTPHFESLEATTLKVLKELQRKSSSLSINLIERKINSKEELSITLERIVTLAYRLLNAESAEMALFDSASTLYHSSFVIGKPFADNAQAVLSGAVDGAEEKPSPDVLVQPIAFAGSVLGSLRVALKKGTSPTTCDKEILRVVALQSGVAILNASYTDELMRMKRASAESVKVKTGFLANLSHEIRGPLGIMLNAVELVLDGLCGAVTVDQLETLKMVRMNGEHLLDLINDVLDYAKIESGKTTPQPVNLLVNDLLKDMISVMKTQAEKKSHTLLLRESSEALTINIDKRHARQMLINLLTNAIKYTPDGGKIEVWAERAASNRVKINVKDSGIGIEESAREKVFSAFERIENSYSITQVGAGLGMAVTKKLAEVNGGQIDFKSLLNQGSHFWISFPAVQFNALEHSKGEEQTVEESVKGNGEVILLMESNGAERDVTSRYLQSKGFTVIAVSTETEALDVLRLGEVKLVLMDNNLIDRQHEDVIQSIRDAAQSNLLPIILVSSKAFPFDIEKYLKIGIDLCLSKPVSLHKLASVCRKVLDGSSTKVAVKTTTDTAEMQKPSLPPDSSSLK